MRDKQRSQKSFIHRFLGFTLVELMIVIVIISILAAVAIPTYKNFVIRSRLAEALAASNPAKQAVALFFSKNDSLPSSNADAQYTDNFSSLYVSAISIESEGSIHIDLKTNDSLGAMSGQSFVLVPDSSGAHRPLRWTCTVANQEFFEYVPNNCANLTSDYWSN